MYSRPYSLLYEGYLYSIQKVVTFNYPKNIVNQTSQNKTLTTNQYTKLISKFKIQIIKYDYHFNHTVL